MVRPTPPAQPEDAAEASSVAAAPHAEPEVPGSRTTEPPASEPELSVPELAELAGASVVLVRTPSGFGSGFVVRRDLIATNLHVVRGQSAIAIQTPRGTRLDVRGVAAISVEWDLAVLYVPDLDLEPLRVGDSERVRVGEPVLAVGNPEGLSLTVSNGIISKKHGDDGTSVLQTTAPISPGSSGGPLIDARGAVIGVMTLYYNQGQALNFAVASARLLDVLDAIDGRYATLKDFAAATAAPAERAATGPGSSKASAFPAAVAGFPFGASLTALRRLCPDLVIESPTLAACPYLRVELGFATGPAQFALADGHLVGVSLQVGDGDALLAALEDKYGEPVALAYRRGQWKPARRWKRGSPGGLQWSSDQGYVRYGSGDGRTQFLVFVDGAQRSIQQANY
jgi:S1-C subfamily serine protease